MQRKFKKLKAIIAMQDKKIAEQSKMLKDKMSKERSKVTVSVMQNYQIKEQYLRPLS